MHGIDSGAEPLFALLQNLSPASGIGFIDATIAVIINRSVTILLFFIVSLQSVEASGAEAVLAAGEESRLDVFFRWVEDSGFTGVTALVTVFVVTSLLMVPNSALMVAAGSIWGLGGGSAVIAVAVFLASSLGFWIGRKVGRNRLLKRFGGRPNFVAVDRAIAEEGAKAIFLLRLAPVFPFGVSNYLYGLTGVRYFAYAVSTVVGSLPVVFLHAYIGTLKRAGAEGIETAQRVALALAFVALFGGFWIIGKICRKALRSSAANTPGGTKADPS